MYTTVYNHTTMPPKKTVKSNTADTAALRVVQVKRNSSENYIRADRLGAAVSRMAASMASSVLITGKSVIYLIVVRIDVDHHL